MSQSLLVVISAPSGGGKTTLTRELMSRFPNSRRSISVTTRPARSTEIPDQDYVFVEDAAFDALVKDNSLAESANVHGYRYGTTKQYIDQALKEGAILFLTLDVQGAASIKTAYPNALTFFVKPPDFDVLESRLRKRGTENEDDIRRRLENARRELSRSEEFDHVVLNDRLDRVTLEIESLIRKKLQS
ncbi:MAG: guanylate kinase [Bdellovibrionota bacterium]